MCFICCLPQDVLKVLLDGWLKLNEVVFVDSAFCNEICRNHLISTMEGKINLTLTSMDSRLHSGCLNWISKRKIHLKVIDLDKTIHMSKFPYQIVNKHLETMATAHLCDCVTSLSFNGCVHIVDSTIMSILQVSVQLRKFSANRTNINDIVIQSLWTHHPLLAECSVKACPRLSAGVGSAFATFQSLVKLDIGQNVDQLDEHHLNFLNNTQFHQLVERCGKSLESLRLQSNFHDGHLCSMGMHCKSLVDCDLSSRAEPIMFQAIKSFIVGCPQLVVLDLSQWECTSQWDFTVSQLFEGIYKLLMNLQHIRFWFVKHTWDSDHLRNCDALFCAHQCFDSVTRLTVTLSQYAVEGVPAVHRGSFNNNTPVSTAHNTPDTVGTVCEVLNACAPHLWKTLTSLHLVIIDSDNKRVNALLCKTIATHCTDLVYLQLEVWGAQTLTLARSARQLVGSTPALQHALAL